jgi:hypothetical protein
MLCVHNLRQRFALWCKFKVVFESPLIVVWLTCFVNHFLQFIIVSFFGTTSQSKLSKGGVLSFFLLLLQSLSSLQSQCWRRMVVPFFKQCIYFCSIFQNVSHLLQNTSSVTFCKGGCDFKVKIFPLESIVFHTFSFDVHWSLSSSLVVFIVILSIPHERMSPQTLSYLSSHFLLWGLTFPHVVCFPCSLFFITSI